MFSDEERFHLNIVLNEQNNSLLWHTTNMKVSQDRQLLGGKVTMGHCHFRSCDHWTFFFFNTSINITWTCETVSRLNSWQLDLS